MYIITSNTSSDISFEVVKNGKVSTVHLKNKFDVTKTEELTKSIVRLKRLGVISSALVNDSVEVTPQKNEEVSADKVDDPQTDVVSETTEDQNSQNEQPQTSNKGRKRGSNNNEKEE